MDRKKVISNFIWRILERCGAQVVTTVVSLVLARLLAPEVYGTVALVLVVTNILQIFIDSGMGNALIQKKDADDLDFSSVFFFNMALCLLLYLGLFLAAPYIAAFYRMPELTALLRVVGLSLIISGVKNIQQAYVSRHLLFKKFFFATLGGTLGSAVVGIWMAYAGYGPWALAGQWLFNALIDTLILWFTVKWRPKRRFSLRRLKGLASYGWKVLVSGLLITVYQNLRQIVIGKFYSTSELAYYNRGMQLPGLLVPNLMTALQSVMLPTIAAAQDRPSEVLGMTRRMMRSAMYLSFPMMVGLAVCGEPLIRLILTEKWLPALPFLYVFCVDYACMAFNYVGHTAILAKGASGAFLKVQTLFRVVDLALLLLTVRRGPLAIACGAVATSLFSVTVSVFQNRKLLGYGIRRQMQDCLPSAALSCVMGGCVWCVRFLGWGDFATLAAQVTLGVGLYVGLSWALRLEIFEYFLHTLRGNKRDGTGGAPDLNDTESTRG